MAQAAARKHSDDAAKASSESFHGSFCWNELMTRDIEGAILPRCHRVDLRAHEDGLGHLLAHQGGWQECRRPVRAERPRVRRRARELDVLSRRRRRGKRVAKAVKAVAKLMKPIFDVPGVGRIAILMQPGGAGVAWMTPKSN